MIVQEVYGYDCVFHVDLVCIINSEGEGMRKLEVRTQPTSGPLVSPMSLGDSGASGHSFIHYFLCA